MKQPLLWNGFGSLGLGDRWGGDTGMRSICKILGGAEKGG